MVNWVTRQGRCLISCCATPSAKTAPFMPKNSIAPFRKSSSRRASPSVGATWLLLRASPPANMAGQRLASPRRARCSRFDVRRIALFRRSAQGCLYRGHVVLDGCAGDNLADHIEWQIFELLKTHTRLAHVEFLACCLIGFAKPLLGFSVAVNRAKVDRHVVLLRPER